MTRPGSKESTLRAQRRKALKRLHDTCYCDAYPFPHRASGGVCRELEGQIEKNLKEASPEYREAYYSSIKRSLEKGTDNER